MIFVSYFPPEKISYIMKKISGEFVSGTEPGGYMMSVASARTWDTKKIILLLIYVAVFLVAMKERTFYACVVIAALLSCWRQFRYGHEWRVGTLWIPGAIFMTCSLISTKFSYDWRFSLFNWCFLPLFYAIFYVLIVSYVREKEEVRRFLAALLGGLLCVVVYGFLQFFHIVDIASDATNAGWVDASRFPLLYRRLYSTLQNPNLFAGYLLMMLGMAGAFFVSLKGKREKSWLGILILLMGVLLLATYSRGAWVAAAAMLAVLAMTYDKRLWLVFLAVPVVLFFYHGQITERFLSIFSREDTSTSMRFALWEATMAMINEHLLTGIGWGIYFATYPWYNFYIQDPTVVIYHAHNMYLHITAENGIPGAIGYFWFFYGHAVLGTKLWRKSKDPWVRAIGFGVMLFIVGLSVYGLCDHVLFGRRLSFLFYGLCALCMGRVLSEKNGNA